MMIFVRLFFEFFKAGLFAIGGGMATLPFLYNISDKTGWFTYGQLADMVAISESTPGPMGVNMATYVGFTTAGPAGAVIATLGLITPSIIVILIIAGFLKAFKTNKYVQNAFYGLRPASTGLIAAAGLSVLSLVLLHKDAFAASGKITDLISIRSIVLLAVLYYFTAVCKKTKGLHPVASIAASAWKSARPRASSCSRPTARRSPPSSSCTTRVPPAWRNRVWPPCPRSPQAKCIPKRPRPRS